MVYRGLSDRLYLRTLPFFFESRVVLTPLQKISGLETQQQNQKQRNQRNPRQELRKENL